MSEPKTARLPGLSMTDVTEQRLSAAELAELDGVMSRSEPGAPLPWNIFGIRKIYELLPRLLAAARRDLARADHARANAIARTVLSASTYTDPDTGEDKLDPRALAAWVAHTARGKEVC